jgi:hypothetical protein
VRLLILSALLIGCAQQPNDWINDEPMFTGVDAQIQPYFDYFTAQTGVQTGKITAGFYTLPSPIAGECVWGGLFNEVRIDPDTWYASNLNNDQRQQLISHELGHCALFLQHINNCSDGTNSATSFCQAQPLSIMNWAMFSQNQIFRLKNPSTNEGLYYQALIGNVPVIYGELK